MTINKAKFERVVEEAKAKAKTNDTKWLRAIEKAAKAILNSDSRPQGQNECQSWLAAGADCSC
jgi:hypothetical protein